MNKTKLNNILNATNDKTVSLRETAQRINDAIESHDATDVDMLAKLRRDCQNAESRASRSQKIAAMSDTDVADIRPVREAAQR
jgi:hypothetical protein